MYYKFKKVSDYLKMLKGECEWSVETSNGQGGKICFYVKSMSTYIIEHLADGQCGTTEIEMLLIQK